MTESYRVVLEKERFVFSAAHFITYDGDVCEPLHGHNYRVRAEVGGPLDENQYVIDFIALRDTIQSIVDTLDHRMLLPTEHRTISVKEMEKEVEVNHGERRWVFPRQDCMLLPVANTTAELLARYIGRELLNCLKPEHREAVKELVIAVDECDGQWGTCQLT